MSVTTVATLRSALGVGTLYTDAVLQSVCDAADQVMLPFLFTNETYNVAHSNTTTDGTLYFEQRVTDIFYVGESVVITKNGTPFNGTKTITAVDVQSISFAVTGSPTEQGYHPVVPLGVVSGTTQTDYTTVDAVKQASLQICEAIWQARQAPSGQGMSVDGFTPSPFTMSNTLLARVRGLLAPYLDPRSMVG
jgi:hypothetical protein